MRATQCYTRREAPSWSRVEGTVNTLHVVYIYCSYLHDAWSWPPAARDHTRRPRHHQVCLTDRSDQENNLQHAKVGMVERRA